DEEHTVNAYEELIPFTNVPNKTTIIVTDEVASEYDVNVDYLVTNAGILITENSSIPLNSEILISYDFGDNWVIEAQTASQKNFEVVLDGVNVGEEGERSVVLQAWRVKFAPTDSFALI